MKKILFLILFSLFSSLYSQTLDLNHYSSVQDGDYDNDYSGVAVALYLEPNKVYDFKENLFLEGSPITKLTKNYKWLIWKALNEWEFYVGENYFVLCAKELDSEEALAFVVEITEKGKSYSWEGVKLASEDLED